MVARLGFVLLLAFGCSIESSGLRGADCISTADCPLTQTCIDGRCIDAPRDAGPDSGEADAGEAVDATVDSGGSDAGPTDGGEQLVPLEIPGLVLWLRADRGTVTDPTGAMAEWQDGSGRAYRFEQSQAGDQPSVRAGAVNGHPGVDFAAGDRLTSQVPIALGAAPALTVIFVVAPQAAGAFLLEASARYDRNAGAFVESIGSSREYVPAHNGTVGTSLWKSTPLELGTWYRLSSVRDVARSTEEVRGYIDNVLDGAPEASSADNAGGFGDYEWHLGARANGTLPFDGTLAELVVYARALTDPERARLDAYLADRYGLGS